MYAIGREKETCSLWTGRCQFPQQAVGHPRHPPRTNVFCGRVEADICRALKRAQLSFRIKIGRNPDKCPGHVAEQVFFLNVGQDPSGVNNAQVVLTIFLNLWRGSGVAHLSGGVFLFTVKRPRDTLSPTLLNAAQYCNYVNRIGPAGIVGIDKREANFAVLIYYECCGDR